MTTTETVAIVMIIIAVIITIAVILIQPKQVVWKDDTIEVRVKATGKLTDDIVNFGDEVALLSDKIRESGFSEVIGFAKCVKSGDDYIVEATIYRPFSSERPVAFVVDVKENRINYIYLSRAPFPNRVTIKQSYHPQE